MDPYEDIERDFAQNRKKFRDTYERIGERGHLPSRIARAEENLRTNALIKMFEESRDAVVLDIGCGDGILLRKIGCQRKIGIDLSYNILRKAQGFNVGILVCADAERLPFRDGMFDIVICTETLEHVLSPKVVISEIHRMLRRGGRVYISVPYEHGIRPVLRKVLGWSDNPLHINRFKENEILDLLEDFNIERMEYFPTRAILLDIMVKAKK